MGYTDTLTRGRFLGKLCWVVARSEAREVLIAIQVTIKVKVAQSCLTLCDLMYYTVHVIL